MGMFTGAVLDIDKNKMLPEAKELLGAIHRSLL